MKRSLLYTLMVCFGIVCSPIAGFSQLMIDDEQLLSEENIPESLKAFFKKYQNEASGTTLRDEDDLVIAVRGNLYAPGNILTFADSAEYTYNDNDELIEVIGRNFIGGNWDLSVKVLYEFDGNGNMTLRLNQVWDGTDWVNDDQDIRIYNGNNNIIRTTQYWNDTIWENNRQYLFEYDSNGNATTQINQIWNDTIWENEIRSARTYNTNDLVTEDFYQTWSGTEWEKVRRILWEYDVNDNLIEWISQDWDGFDWINDRNYKNGYDANENLVTRFYGNWTGAAWQEYEQEFYEYDADNRLIFEYERKWDGIIWEDYTRGYYTYDTTDNPVYWLGEIWDGTTWNNHLEITQVFDAEDNLLDYTFREWSGASWDKIWEFFFYYQIVTNTAELEATELDFEVFPNPSKGYLNLKLTGNLVQNGSLNVFNTLGQLVHYQKNVDAIINLSHLPGGTYILQLNLENQQISRKIQLLD